ncbi:hypothetical protein [uncultured Rhodospira sp.]|uniref:hypothetical protein n=1 Tax=uncultured Rhodospira sp. TaxID=1936189 RepID=UPI00260FBD5E|nr:hypothetical protein [uncultured Rhodospira sp.]
MENTEELMYDLGCRLFGALDEEALDVWHDVGRDSIVVDPKRDRPFCGLYTMEEDGREGVTIFLPEERVTPLGVMVHELGHWFHCKFFRDLSVTVATGSQPQRAEAAAVYTELVGYRDLVFWDLLTRGQWAHRLLINMRPDVLRLAKMGLQENKTYRRTVWALLEGVIR